MGFPKIPDSADIVRMCEQAMAPMTVLLVEIRNLLQENNTLQREILIRNTPLPVPHAFVDMTIGTETS